MALEVGNIVEGKVTGITKFGAFVALPEGKSGLVHISEIANSFVSDVNAFVQMGQTVKVRVLSISEEGKINLSIKRATEEAPYMERPRSSSDVPESRTMGVPSSLVPRPSTSKSRHTPRGAPMERRTPPKWYKSSTLLVQLWQIWSYLK